MLDLSSLCSGLQASSTRCSKAVLGGMCATRTWVCGTWSWCLLVGNVVDKSHPAKCKSDTAAIAQTGRPLV